MDAPMVDWYRLLCAIHLCDGRYCSNGWVSADEDRARGYVFIMPEGYVVEVNTDERQWEYVGTYPTEEEAKAAALGYYYLT